MKKYSTIKSVIIALIITTLLIFILPNIPLSDYLTAIIFVLGGFIATYLSIANEAKIGLYIGLVWDIGYLPVILIYKNFLTPYLVIYMLLFLILSFIGGFISKQLRLRLEDGDEKIKN